MTKEKAMDKIRVNAEKRERLKNDFQILQRKRDEFIRSKEQGADNTFGTVLKEQIRKQATDKGFSFNEN